MKYSIVYFVIGLVISILLSEIDKQEIDGEGRNVIENTDRFIFILLWPIIVVGFIKGLIENDNS
jgi:membrane protein CcdC involved in cytochrome C biogenesis